MKPGDKVYWTHTSKRGRIISMTLRHGILESLENDVAVVVKKNGTRMHTHRSLLTTAGQSTEVDRVVRAIRAIASDEAPL